MAARDYDAIVVGASFGGLAVARQLRGNVLLIDRNEVGSVQTSACGTPLWVPQALGVSASVLQVHDRLNIRTPRRTISYDLSAVPFCTFDYRVFCEGLLAQTSARFLQAGVTGFAEGAVTTTEGRFTAPVVVDCSGWRGAVVQDGAPDATTGAYSFGLETHTALDDQGLWFLLDQKLIPHGLGWIFPVGAGSLIGLGSYVGRSKLKPPLDRYLRDQGIAPGSYHGTYFPNRLPPGHGGQGLRRRGCRGPVLAPHRGGDPPGGLLRQRMRPDRAAGARRGDQPRDGTRHVRPTGRALPGRLPDPQMGAVARRACADAVVRCPYRARGAPSDPAALVAEIRLVRAARPGLGADRAMTGPAFAAWRAHQ